MRINIIIPIRFEDRAVQGRVMEDLLASVRPRVGTDVELAIESLSEGTLSIEGRADLAWNQGAVMEAVRRSQEAGFDGVFVSDMDMCGVEPARELVDIPVIGGFAASAFTALMLGRRIGLITISPRVVPMQADHFRTYGIESNLSGIRVAEVSVADLIDDPVAALDGVYAQAVRAIDEDGAEVLILGCTGFIGIAGPLAVRLARGGREVPVLDPNATAVGYLELLIRQKLRHSPAAYPPRPRSRIAEFQT